MSSCQSECRMHVFKVKPREAYSTIPEGSSHTGLLVSVEAEGENYYIIRLGQVRLAVPRMVRTRGGHVDLAAWVGQEIEVCCYNGQVSARLVPLDEQQMRIWELEEAIARCLPPNGANMSFSEAMKLLGISGAEPMIDRSLLHPFFKYSCTKENRLKALSAVVP